MPSKELRQIKKIYGEKFMHLCRELFPIILEKEGVLLEILKSNFANNSRSLAESLSNEEIKANFKTFVFDKLDEDVEEEITVVKTPYELLDEAGYELVECHTEEEIQRFKKYYAKGEELCTFNGGRLNRSVVYFAVRKDVKDIRREDFDYPERDDEYGTSVMSIQFNKIGLCTVSIKNRYNHRVHNPDATLGNDLDRIIPGLTNSFAKVLLEEKGLSLNKSNVEKFQIPGYVVAGDGRYYKYNFESFGQYFCPGNIVITDGEIRTLDPSKELLIDNYVFDLQKKNIYSFSSFEKGGFEEGLQDLEDSKIEVTTNKETETRLITITSEGKEPVTIEIDKDNNIVGYSNKNLKEIGSKFLTQNIKLKKLDIPNVEKIGNLFCSFNTEMKELSLPKVEEIGELFFYNNKSIKELDLPNLKIVGKDFFVVNTVLKQLNAPNLKIVGESFLLSNEAIESLSLEKLEEVGEGFLFWNVNMKELNVPNLRIAGENFCCSNEGIEELSFKNLEQAGTKFFYNNQRIKRLDVPKLKIVRDDFIPYNTELKELNLNSLEQVGDKFLKLNKKIKNLEAPNLKIVGDYFLPSNTEIKELSLKSLEQVGNDFLTNNMKTNKLEAPNLKIVKDSFLEKNREIDDLDLKSLEKIGNDFLRMNVKMKKLEAPNLRTVGNNFLLSNALLEELSLDNLNRAGDSFLMFNQNLMNFYAPNLKTLGNAAFNNNEQMQELKLESLEKVGRDFFHANQNMKKFYAPNLKATDNMSPVLVEAMERANIENETSLEESLKTNSKDSSHVTSNDIAELSKDRNISFSLMEKTRNVIRKIKEKAKMFLNNNNKEEIDEEVEK